MIYIDCEQEDEEEEDALFSTREKPPCCFSQSQGIQVIGVVSCVSIKTILVYIRFYNYISIMYYINRYLDFS
jgi:hypothetical protein